MEFTVNAKRFKESFSLVGRVVPTRSVRPVLQSVKVVADRDSESLAFSASDNEVSIRNRLANSGGFQPVSVARGGSVLLPKSLVDSVLKVADAELMTFRLEDAKLHVRAGAAKWTLATEDVALFPDVPDFGCAAYHTLAVPDFKRLVKRTAYATDPNSTQYALGGMLAESSGVTLTLTGFISAILGSQTASATFAGEVPSGDTQRVIPLSTLNVLIAMIGDGPEAIDLGFPDDNGVQFRFGDTAVTARLLHGRFPPWRRAIPSDGLLSVESPVGPLRRAIDQAAAIRSEDTHRITLSFGPGSCRLSGGSELGDSDVEFPIAWDHPATSVDVNPAYFAELLKSLGDDATATFGLKTDDTTPRFVVSTGDGFLGMVATMTKEQR